jgi:hypothetical protein
MNKLHRDILQLCQDVIEGPRACGMLDRATSIKERLTVKRRPSPSSRYKGQGAKTRRADKVAARRLTMSELRDLALARADRGSAPGYVIGDLSGQRVPVEQAQLLHLNGGVGRRRETQSIENVCIDSDWVNQDSDKRPAFWLPKVKAFCARIKAPLPPRWVAIEAKLELKAALAAGGNHRG